MFKIMWTVSQPPAEMEECTSLTEMTAMVLKAESRWIVLAAFQEMGIERTVSWKCARGATEGENQR